MTAEDRLRSLRLQADAAPLRASVLLSARRSLRERRIWRWTWAAAALVAAVAIPLNLSADRVGSALAARHVPGPDPSLPAEIRHVLRSRSLLASTRPAFPRTLEDIR